ncbi:hypothetical protein [Bacillus sp. UNC41MFS5]|uniref:hypothetical protein n=1 Tax=Bacillus sp. UNC41MFS5 TaxID=1449046 RepID=UPI00047DD476|nr:hypothetical protein [Bacillus sp. UNC41MFS5]
MEDRKQYRDELLEWCNNLNSYWNSMKPEVSNRLDTESLEAWEGACLQLQEKLEADETVEFEDYLTAKGLYEQWEQLVKGTDAHPEVMEVDSEYRLELEEDTQIHEVLFDLDATQEELEVVSDHRMEIGEQTEIHNELWESDATQEELVAGSDHRLVLEEQPQIHDELLATNASQEVFGLEKTKGLELEEQLYYREDLLERCNHIYSNWESMKPSFSKLFESLVEWEVSYRHFKEKLQADIKADFDDYQKAKSLLDSGNGMLMGKK